MVLRFQLLQKRIKNTILFQIANTNGVTSHKEKAC